MGDFICFSLSNTYSISHYFLLLAFLSLLLNLSVSLLFTYIILTFSLFFLFIAGETSFVACALQNLNLAHPVFSIFCHIFHLLHSNQIFRSFAIQFSKFVTLIDFVCIFHVELAFTTNTTLSIQFSRTTYSL